MPTLIQQLSTFATATRYEDLPPDVVRESQRTLLDSIGCAVAGAGDKKGKIGIEFGRMLGGSGGLASVLATGEQLPVFGAAFANAELINALDYDTILPPGHVTPYVLPAALAVAESVGSSGKDYIVASAIAHEMSYRMGKAMDYLRDTRDGKADPPAIFGYSSTIFGATAAAGRLRGQSAECVGNALGIAGAISPVNTHWPWFKHVPSTTIKYMLGGNLTQSALTASFMAELGHTGDLQILDDREFGYARFIGTQRWLPEEITTNLGTEWRFTPFMAYKPYPHCRILHALLELMRTSLVENNIQLDEIEGIKVWVEGFVEQPAWLNRDIKQVLDAQFSIAHGIALGAHLVPPGKKWHDPQLIFKPSVISLMDKVSYEVHPDYASARSANASAIPARVEISARGQKFVSEQNYPKGVKSPDPRSYMTDGELIAKFLDNVEDALPAAVAREIVDGVMELHNIDDVGEVMRKLAPGNPSRSLGSAAAVKDPASVSPLAPLAG